MPAPSYRGSVKHKARPGRGRNGTLCPEWTHSLANDGFAGDPFAHVWENTLAHDLFQTSELDPEGSGKRYATKNGIAFAAQDSADGTWHGYPEPWQKVPAVLKDLWLGQGKVTAANLRRYKDFPRADTRWALDSNDD